MERKMAGDLARHGFPVCRHHRNPVLVAGWAKRAHSPRRVIVRPLCLHLTTKLL